MSLVLFSLLFVLLGAGVEAQSTSTIEVSIDFGDGLIYFLVVLFFAVNFATPIIRWVYEIYLSVLVEKAGKEVTKASKRFTERMSDASRRISQGVRAER